MTSLFKAAVLACVVFWVGVTAKAAPLPVSISGSLTWTNSAGVLIPVAPGINIRVQSLTVLGGVTNSAFAGPGFPAYDAVGGVHLGTFGAGLSYDPTTGILISSGGGGGGNSVAAGTNAVAVTNGFLVTISGVTDTNAVRGLLAAVTNGAILNLSNYSLTISQNATNEALLLSLANTNEALRQATSITNTLGLNLSNLVWTIGQNATNHDLAVTVTNGLLASTNALLVTLGANIAAADATMIITTNGGQIRLAANLSGGSATNAVGFINGTNVVLVSAATNLDFWPGTSFYWWITNRAGHVDIFPQVDFTPATNQSLKIGANDTNQTWLIGQNATNNDILSGINLTNGSINNLSNLVTTISANATNEVVREGSFKADKTTTITVNGTANQVASSAGAQDLSANRTWTLSTPNPFIAPGSVTANIILIVTNAASGVFILPTGTNITLGFYSTNAAGTMLTNYWSANPGGVATGGFNLEVQNTNGVDTLQVYQDGRIRFGTNQLAQIWTNGVAVFAGITNTAFSTGGVVTNDANGNFGTTPYLPPLLSGTNAYFAASSNITIVTNYANGVFTYTISSSGGGGASGWPNITNNESFQPWTNYVATKWYGTNAEPGHIELADTGSNTVINLGQDTTSGNWLKYTNPATAVYIISRTNGDVFTTGKTSAAGITNTSFASAGVTTNDANGKLYTSTGLPLTSLLQSGAVSGQVPKWTGTIWQAQDVQGVTIPATITQTNFVANTTYTNKSGSVQLLDATIALITTGVSGSAAMDLMVDQAGGNTFTLADRLAISTAVTTIAMNYTNNLFTSLSNNACYYLTNTSTGAGDSSAVVPGTGSLTTLSDGAAANVVSTSRLITVNGTANQITSSAGAQDLSADRTWTLSFPNIVFLPGTLKAAGFTNTANTLLQGTETNSTLTGPGLIAADSLGGRSVAGTSALLAANISDESGSGLAMFSGAPTLTNALIKGDVFGTNGLSVSTDGTRITNNLGGIYATGNVLYATGPISVNAATNRSATAYTLLASDSLKAQTSIPNTTAGNPIVNGGASVLPYETNTVPIAIKLSGTWVDSISIPLASFYTNNDVVTPNSPASPIAITNISSGFSFAPVASNQVHVVFSMPMGWDLSPLRVRLKALALFTNSILTTNIAWRVGAYCIPPVTSYTNNLTATFLECTNNVPPGLTYQLGNSCVTTDLTPAGTLSPTNSIYLSIRRDSAQSTAAGAAWILRECTNTVALADDVIVYYTRTNATAMPTPTP